MASLVSYALTTVSDVKETLGIPSSNTDSDNLIIRKINQATDMIETYTGRRFVVTDYTQEYDATNIDQLILKQRPVVTLTSFEVRDSTLNENDWDSIESTLYFTDEAAGVIDLNFSASGRWNRYRVEYSAGYDPLPSDLTEACATLAAYLVDSGTSGTNVKKKQEGARSVEYFDPKAGSSSTSDIFDILNLTVTLNAYANNPILADK